MEKAVCRLETELLDRLTELGIAYETEEIGGGAGSELREQVESIERWYLNDWTALDAKLRTSIRGEEDVPEDAAARVHAAAVRAPRQLSGDLPALRRREGSARRRVYLKPH